MTFVFLLDFCPGALMSVPLIDLSVTSGDHLSLNVPLPNEQLCHGAFVGVFGDASNSDVLAHQKISQMVSSSFGWHWFSSLPAWFRGVDAGQSKPFASSPGARIDVVAGGDHDECKSCN